MHLLIIWTKDLMKKNLDSYDHETKSGLVIKKLTNNIAIIIISNFGMKNFNGDDFFWDYHVVSCIKSSKSKARQKI